MGFTVNHGHEENLEKNHFFHLELILSHEKYNSATKTVITKISKTREAETDPPGTMPVTKVNRGQGRSRGGRPRPGLGQECRGRREPGSQGIWASLEKGRGLRAGSEGPLGRWAGPGVAVG